MLYKINALPIFLISGEIIDKSNKIVSQKKQEPDEKYKKSY